MMCGPVIRDGVVFLLVCFFKPAELGARFRFVIITLALEAATTKHIYPVVMTQPANVRLMNGLRRIVQLTSACPTPLVRSHFATNDASRCEELRLRVGG